MYQTISLQGWILSRHVTIRTVVLTTFPFHFTSWMRVFVLWLFVGLRSVRRNPILFSPRESSRVLQPHLGFHRALSVKCHMMPWETPDIPACEQALRSRSVINNKSPARPMRPINRMEDLKIHLVGPLGYPRQDIWRQQKRILSNAHSTLPQGTTKYWPDHPTFLHWWSVGRPNMFAYFRCCSGVHVKGLILPRQQCKLGQCWSNVWTTMPTLANVGPTYIVVRVKMRTTGGRLNKKDGLTRYGNSHVKDKTS